MAVIMTRERIEAILPQRPPMLLLDEITGLMPGDQVMGSFTIPQEAPWLEGHYPTYPVTPGFMVLEICFQALQICVLAVPENQEKDMFLMEASKMKFNGRALPGDKVDVTVKISKNRGDVFNAKATAEVAGKSLATAEFVASISSGGLQKS